MIWRIVLLAGLALGAAGCIEDSESPSDEREDAARADAAVADADPGPDAEATPDAAVQVDAEVVPDMAPPPAPCGNEDDLAPNQTADAATPIEPGFARNDLFLCPESADWFEVGLRAGQGLTVRILADPPETDLDLAVLDADGVVLDESINDGGREGIEFFAPAAGRYLVRVSGYRDEAAFYAMEVSSGCALDAQCPEGQLCNRFEGACERVNQSVCGDDAFEENDRDDQAVAFPEAGVLEAVICGADRDWFAVQAEDGDSFDVLAAFAEGQDVDLFVIEAATGAIVAQAINPPQANPERLSMSNLPAGAYHIGVVLSLPQGQRDREVDYRLEVAGRSGGCRADRDCRSARFPVCDEGVCRAIEANGDVPPGGQCGDDGDCDAGSEFCYTGGSGGHDNFCTRQCDEDGACRALGDGAHCVPVQRNLAVCFPACAGDDECSAFRTCVEGRCEIRGECATDRDCEGEAVCQITRFGRFCGLPGQDAGCGLDAANDPNDRVDQATPIALDGTPVEGLFICDDDTDWYQVTVPAEAAAFTLSMGVEFRDGVDIDVYAFDANGRPMGEATSADETAEFVEIRFVAPGDYFLQVDQFSSDALADTEYTFFAELIDNEDRCTVKANECGRTDPLRALCDEETGACLDLPGNGAVELGGVCDSQDDCNEDAEVCWNFEGGDFGVNICTITCQGDGDCEAIEGTECMPFQGGRFAVCLPPR